MKLNVCHGCPERSDCFLGMCWACGGTGEQEAEGPIEDGLQLITCAECGGNG